MSVVWKLRVARVKESKNNILDECVCECLFATVCVCVSELVWVCKSSVQTWFFLYTREKKHDQTIDLFAWFLFVSFLLKNVSLVPFFALH